MIVQIVGKTAIAGLPIGVTARRYQHTLTTVWTGLSMIQKFTRIITSTAIIKEFILKILHVCGAYLVMNGCVVIDCTSAIIKPSKVSMVLTGPMV